MCRLKLVVLLSLMGPLAGCSTYSLHELRHTPPKGTPFQAALALKYLRFAEEEETRYDWVDSGYFADKGLLAAYGNDVPPEDLAHWDIEGEKREALSAARERLMAALTEEARVSRPQMAAEAQFHFDCWVENQEEEWQEEEIARCRDGFMEAMQALEAVPAAEASGEEVAAPRDAYIVFFGMNRAELDEQGERIVDGVVEEIKKIEEGYEVVLHGHTDTVGNTRYNFELSKSRADAMLAALVERGIPKTRIHAFGFGETDPAVPTKDDTPMPQNRRVEVFIGD